MILLVVLLAFAFKRRFLIISFDNADEVVMVDLPPDDLQQRLNEGKVYLAGQAERNRAFFS